MVDEETQVSEKMRVGLLSVVVTIILALAGWAISIGSNLADAIRSLERAVAVLELKVDALPPKSLLLRLDNIREEQSEIKLEQRRLQRQIDRLEGGHPHVKNQPLPEYVED